MRIEDYWEDISLYLIEYINYKDQLIMINDFLVVPEGFSEEQIKKEILSLFPDARSIDSIHEYSEGLCEK